MTAGRIPSINDLPLLPLSNALIMEVQRHGNVAASGLEHTATEDVDMEGYTIKKGTRMWYNLFQHHFDEKFWGPDSRDFNPARFLDQTKKGESRLATKVCVTTECFFHSVARFGR